MMSVTDVSWYFLHIPKTAGTTFRVFLENQFHLQQICPAYEFFELKKYAEAELAQMRLFRGHLGYNLINYLQQPLRTLVMLRNPMERAVSHFDYIRRDPSHPKYEQIQRRGLDLKGYLLDEVLSAEVTNAQVRPLAHTADQKTLQELLGSSASQQEFAKAWRHTPGVLPADNELLDVAMQRLEQMDFVGIAEQLQQGLQLAAWMLNAKPPENVQSLNINHQRTPLDELSEDTLEILQQATALDFALYTRGQELFQQQYQALKAQPQTEKQQRQMFYVSDKGGDVLEVDFQQPLYGSGWHQRELKPGKGILRWTRADKAASIDVKLVPDQAYELKIHLAAWVSDKLLHSLKLLFNHEPLLVDVVEVQGELFYVAQIPASLVTGDAASLQLKFSHSQAQNGIFQQPANASIDHNRARQVGVAVHGFVFTPV